MILGILFFCTLLFILGPGFFSDGGILLLDYVSTPFDGSLQWTNSLGNLHSLVSALIGYEWGTKIVFIFILLLSGLLGYLFSIKIISQSSIVYYPKTIIFVSIIFFLINPFLYERMMVQPIIYLGIILVGYALYSLLFLVKYKWIVFGFVSGIAVSLFLHASFMVFVILVLYGVFFIRKKEDVFGMFLAGVIIIICNLNWLLAPLFGSTNVLGKISDFNLINFDAFATNALAPLNVWLTNIFLYGFWGERYTNHYVNVEFLSSLWFLAGFIVLCIVVVGFYKSQKFKKEKIFLGVVLVISLMFSVGVASEITRDLTFFMAKNIPFWQGYREPQKWTGIIMIIEGIFFIFGLIYLFQKIGKDRVIYGCALLSLLGLLLVWSPGPLNGFHGQLKTTIFPLELYQFRHQKMQENFSGKILILPWHSYLGCSWIGRPTIANPMKKFLSEFDIVVADNIQVGTSLYSNSLELQSQKIENFISQHQASLLVDNSIDSILLMKNCANSQSYEWLDDISECKKTIDNEILSFYQCL